MLKGKSAIVTGSTSGIGLAIARAFAKEGCNLLLNGFGDPGGIEAERKSIEKEYGVTAIYSPADMSRPEQIEAMIALAGEKFGKTDILVNNAGIQHVAPIEDFPPEKWDQILAINLSSAFYTVRAALPAMKKAGWGRIINIASAHGLRASPFKVAYVAAKHGLVGMTKTVALECAEIGITCNAICPGFVLTPLVQKQIDDQAKTLNMPPDRVAHEVILSKQPSKQFVKLEEVAALAVFLAGDAAASITGAAYAIDGGWTAQ